MAHQNNEQNLIPLNQRSPEEQAEIRKKAQKARWEKVRERKTLSQLMRLWAERGVSEKDKQALRNLGLSEEDYNKTLLIAPIIKNISKGDIKSIQLAIELLGEDEEKNLKIKKLEQEIEKLKLEQDQLKTLNSALNEQIQIVMDVDKDKDNEEEEQ